MITTDRNGVAHLSPDQQAALGAMGINITPVPEPPAVRLSAEQRDAKIMRDFADRQAAAFAQEAAAFARAEARLDEQREAAMRAEMTDWRSVLGNPLSLDDAEAVYRDRAKLSHPDTGGDDESMRRLNAAIAAARKHFG